MSSTNSKQCKLCVHNSFTCNAWFLWEEASRIFFVYNGGTTSIGEISTPNVLQGAVYNLNGQFMGADVDLKSLPKGIYMVDGKKVVNY